jgi:hypothetical protein
MMGMTSPVAMKEETPEARAAFIRLRYFEERVIWSRDTLARHERELAEERQKYAAARPLTESEREELAKHVEAGGSLCCEDGLVWLRDKLPEIWAQAINGWAYEALACQAGAHHWKDHATKVRNLKLDQLPRFS